MSENVTYRVVTANRVRDGVPIFFAGNGMWSPKVDDAKHADAAAGDNLLAEAGTVPLEVIAPYVIEVVLADGHISPVLLRERIRAFGPTA